MTRSLRQIVEDYDFESPLEAAATVPSAWYTDRRIDDLERLAVFGRNWQVIGRLDQLAEPGQYITTEVAGEPIIVVRGNDHTLRAFYNVCRHHAAAVMTETKGRCKALRCPYHAWTYSLEGELKTVPEFDGVRNFDKSQNSLIPIAVDTWENCVFVNLSPANPGHLGSHLTDLPQRLEPLNLSSLQFFERRSYDLNCNWKVYVDNYLDGGYHVPHLHKGLNSVLDYGAYTIEIKDHYCLQSSPMTAGGKDAEAAVVRKGDRAYYYWLYPNFMLNWYEGVMDTNLVLPLAVDRCRVIFDFYFEDVSGAATTYNRKSIDVGERIQQEDVDICESVQRGLNSRAYDTGRLSVRREAGEHLFHRLLYQDLRTQLDCYPNADA